MANIDKLKGLDTPVGAPAHHLQARSEREIREQNRDTRDFLYAVALMQESPRYRFAGETLEGIYTTVDHSGRVSEGQRRAINNIRTGCGDGEI